MNRAHYRLVEVDPRYRGVWLNGTQPKPRILWRGRAVQIVGALILAGVITVPLTLLAWLLYQGAGALIRGGGGW